MTDVIRVLRIIEYVGPRAWVEKTINKSIHATKIFHIDPSCKISAATIGTFPELLEIEEGF